MNIQISDFISFTDETIIIYNIGISILLDL